MKNYLTSLVFIVAVVIISGCGGVADAINDSVENGLYGNSDLSRDIKDNKTMVQLVNVSSDYKTLTKVAYITLNIQHDRVGDLKIELTSPSGTNVVLSNYRGGNSSVNGITFKDDSSNSIVNFNGTNTDYKPEQPLATFVGENPNGIWVIKVTDSVNNSKIGKLTGYILFINGQK